MDDTKTKILNQTFYGVSRATKDRNKLCANGRMSNINNCKAVYSIDMDTLFYSAIQVFNEYGFDPSSIIKCCRNKAKTCGAHPMTKEPLHWLYAEDQTQKDGTIIPGAITLGYITEERVQQYLNNLKQKEND